MDRSAEKFQPFTSGRLDTSRSGTFYSKKPSADQSAYHRGVCKAFLSLVTNPEMHAEAEIKRASCRIHYD